MFSYSNRGLRPIRPRGRAKRLTRMDQTARVLGALASLEPIRQRPASQLLLTLEVSDPEVLAELRRQPEGLHRDRYALAALRLGLLAPPTAHVQAHLPSLRA